MTWDLIRNTLLTTRIGRSISDALFRRRARRRLVNLDEISPVRGQLRSLLGMIHRARATRFGMDHDFQRIRTVEDFRRLVPLRAPADLWHQYGLTSLPHLENAVWPGPISYLGTSDTAINDLHAPLTVTGDLAESHREALLTSLSLVQQARPHARLLSGSLLMVGGGVALTPLRERAARHSLENLVQGQLPGLLRPFTWIAPQFGHASLRQLAERMLDESITTLVGSAARLQRLCSLLQKLSGNHSLLDLWPQLTAIIYTRSNAEQEREQLKALLGDHPRAGSVLVLEGVVHPQGVVAVEDPRYKRLRVLTHHGVYFELIPLEDMGAAQPRRLGLHEAVPGVPYAMALTSPAGVWACMVGITITFASGNPPLLESVEMGQPIQQPGQVETARTDVATEINPPVGRRYIDDTPARQPGKLSRNLWS